MVNVSIASILKLALKTCAMESESEYLLGSFSFSAVLSNLSATLTNSPFLCTKTFMFAIYFRLKLTHTRMCVSLFRETPFIFVREFLFLFRKKIESESERMTTKAAKKDWTGNDMLGRKKLTLTVVVASMVVCVCVHMRGIKSIMAVEKKNEKVLSFLIIECCVRREGCVMVETRCGAVNGPKPRKEWKGMKILLCVEPYEILCSTKMIFNLDKLLIFSRNRKHTRWEGWNASAISRAYIYAISYNLSLNFQWGGFNATRRNSRKICIFCWRCHCHGIIYDYDTLLSSSKRERGKKKEKSTLANIWGFHIVQIQTHFSPFSRYRPKYEPINSDSHIYFIPSLSLTRRRLAAAAVREWMEEKHMKKNPTLRKKEENIKKLFLEREKKRVLCVGPGKAEKSMGCRVRMAEW